MRTDELDYHLPEEQIAQRPLERRSDARLLCVDRSTGARAHERFAQLPTLLPAGALLVVNDTKVFPARLRGVRPTGGQVELLLLRHQGEDRWSALGKPRKKLRVGTHLEFDTLTATVLDDTDEETVTVGLRSKDGDSVHAALDRGGAVPLPPYIRREPDQRDLTRYQTLFASHLGSVAAPTAGLHFDQGVLGRLEGHGHRVARVTLHVGPGTFRPVRSESLTEHVMDSERYAVSEDTAAAIEEARAQGRPVIAVGTTVVRTLESVAVGDGLVTPGEGETTLFITPGHRFRVVDGLVTNFHLPRSTLLALVCAFAGRDAVLDAYRDAVAQGYRFYSYGDAMFLR